MGLLTAAQRTAITSAPVYRQVWKFHRPRASGGNVYDATTFHDDDGGPICVADAGQIVVEGYNQSLAEPGRLSNGLYRIRVDNSDQMFNIATSGNWFYNSGYTYQADPVECHLEHEVYVWDGAAGAWSELTMVNFRGPIQGVEYDDDAPTATIEAVSFAQAAMEYIYTSDDGTEEDTGMNVTWP